MRLLYLWLAVVIFTVIPNNKALSKQKNVFKITIVDRPRYSSTLDITFYDDSTKMMILINPLDYLKYRWFWIVLKYNYKKRNYEQGLFDRKDNPNE